MMVFDIPAIPAPIHDFIPYVASHPQESLTALVAPYKAFEGELRKVFAQDPKNGLVQDGLVNAIPVFSGHESDITTRARILETETVEEAEKYLMPLKDADRHTHGSPAIVTSLKEFQDNFNLFSEGAMSDMDWKNVVVCGSAVTTPLLPIPNKYRGSKRLLREYYHEKIAPASDVDLFIYGLDEAAAIEKMKQIEAKVKDSILHETTTIRTKNAVTIASQYPTRHIQIVLRLYDSISQIITGFDVDCACVAYDGTQVYAAPRALTAFMSQANEIDLTRRSPSYENRLSKYAQRGFEIYWPLLDRSRVDPTIFERSFNRTLGLARLLVLEKLPKSVQRDRYMDLRRQERGRPVTSHRRNMGKLYGNLKEEQEEVADWFDEEEISSYTTVVVPYGPKYAPRKINKLLYTRDYLLNAEWNKDPKREVNLHRHPCFMGDMEYIIHDCCGNCPVPVTEEEIEIAAQEGKRYISGPLTFIKDDPGRQEIGSFNPLTADDWTDMAYVGNTERLCRAITENDLEYVQHWCSLDGNDVNCRDITGRTPLHLATMVASVEIIAVLISHGARMIARLVDGRTALHLAASRGEPQIVKLLMEKSAENEEENDAKEEQKKAASKVKSAEVPSEDAAGDSASDEFDEETDWTSDDGNSTTTAGSFVKIRGEATPDTNVLPEDDLEEPDIIDIETRAWDYPFTPLHFAIVNGREEMIKLLVEEYAADVLSAVKIKDNGNEPLAAILSTALALVLPSEKAVSVVKLLLRLGATTAQVDSNQLTMLHNLARSKHSAVLDAIFEVDKPAASRAINHVSVDKWNSQASTPLAYALSCSTPEMTEKLLLHGAKPIISYDDWVAAAVTYSERVKQNTAETNANLYKTAVLQPIYLAARDGMPELIPRLLAGGADPNTLSTDAQSIITGRYCWTEGYSVLDVVRNTLKSLREYKGEPLGVSKPSELRSLDYYMSKSDATPGTYKHFYVANSYRQRKMSYDSELSWYNDRLGKRFDGRGAWEKFEEVHRLADAYETAEAMLIAAGAKTFNEMYPEHKDQNARNRWRHQSSEEPKDWDVVFTFSVPDLTEGMRFQYLKLFQAAWENDVETVKKLTLSRIQVEGYAESSPPLKIAVLDDRGFSPFSIAILRGHVALANTILEISLAQYKPSDSKPRRWVIAEAESDHEHCGCDYDSDYDYDYYESLERHPTGVLLTSHLVDDNFTIERIGEVSDMVQSPVAPLTMMNWACRSGWFSDGDDTPFTLIEWAVRNLKMSLVKYLIRTATAQSHLQCKTDAERTPYRLTRSVFQEAMKTGHPAMLAELIKTTGVGIPFDESVLKDSGIQMRPATGFYQGLSIKGEKKTEWAKQHQQYAPITSRFSPPILEAAASGSIATVEWFLGDAPLQSYKEFAANHPSDPIVQALQVSSQGFDRFMKKWLTEKLDLLLHCVVLAGSGEKEMNMLDHLIKKHPELVETKSDEGWTPLLMTAFKHNAKAAERLVAAGANQRVRDKSGRNFVHLALAHPNDPSTRADLAHKASTLFELLDKDAIAEMCLEKAHIRPGAVTPLALSLQRYSDIDVLLGIIDLLFSYSNGAEYKIINGEGDLLLHTAVKRGFSVVVEKLFALRPELMGNENSAGKTASELAADLFLNEVVSSHYLTLGQINNSYGRRGGAAQDISISCYDPARRSRLCDPQQTHDLCVAKTKEQQQSRQLVRLWEANEVARRISDETLWEPYTSRWAQPQKKTAGPLDAWM